MLTNEDLQILESQQPAPNGLTCPKCGGTLLDVKPIELLTSHKACKKDTICQNCGDKGTRYV